MRAILSSDQSAFTLAGKVWREKSPVQLLPAKLAFYRGLAARKGGAYARNAYNHVRDDMDLASEDITGMDSSDQVMAEVRAMRDEAKALENPGEKSNIESGATKDSENDGNGNRPDDPQSLEAGQGSGKGLAGSGTDEAGEGASQHGGGGNAGDHAAGDDAGGSLVGSRPSLPDPSLGISAGGLTGPSGENPGNFAITDALGLGAGTDGQKISGNIAAIRLVKALEAENRFPSRAEQATLARYVGWGGLKSVFDIKKKGAADMWGRATPASSRRCLSALPPCAAKEALSLTWRGRSCASPAG